MRRHIRPTFGSTPIASIDRTTIREWLAMLLEHEDKVLAPATVQKVSQILNKALRAAQEDRLISANPAERMTLPKIEREEMRFLNVAEVHHLADAIDPRYRGFVLLGAYGGLQLGEMLALQVGRVDVERQRVRVLETLVDLNGYQTIGPPKPKAAVRNVTVPGFVIEALNLEGRESTDFVFQSPEGGAVRGSSWRRRFWRPATVKAEVGPLRIHDLRHTAISLWIAAGANPKQVAVRAGHTSVSVVFDRYGHLYEDQTLPSRCARSWRSRGCTSQCLNLFAPQGKIDGRRSASIVPGMRASCASGRTDYAAPYRVGMGVATAVFEAISIGV